MAKVRRCGGLAVADAVLAVVEALAPEELASCFWLEAYSNGREQGYVILSPDVAVAFSENRNSDDIVIYVGTPKDFYLELSEKVYKGRRGFAYGDFGGAAQHIIDEMEKSERYREKRAKAVATV